MERAAAGRYMFASFTLDTDEERVWKAGKEMPMRRKPFAILRHLVANPKRLVTQDELLEHVWNGAVVSESAMRTHVHELRQILGEGVIETVVGRGYRFIAELGREDVVAPPSRTPTIVGRAAELATLRAALDRALAGRRQLCFVTGDPGMGKTSVVEAFLDELAERSDVTTAIGRCVEQYGSPEAYVSVIELLAGLCRSPHGERVLATLLRHAPEFLALVPHLIPEDRFEDVTKRARGGTEGRLVRELIEAPLLHARRPARPVREQRRRAALPQGASVTVTTARVGRARCLRARDPRWTLERDHPQYADGDARAARDVRAHGRARPHAR